MKTQSPAGGRIINNGSVSAHTPRPNATPYNAAKHAITGLTKSIALDHRSAHIACGQIDIGNATSDMSADMDNGMLQADGTTAPEPRFDAQHVADTLLHLARLPLDVNIPFVTITANQMPYIGRG
jgi:NAD(P)-dependent dehydrogenase (short-subunit alcohol dehydrogenase family)